MKSANALFGLMLSNWTLLAGFICSLKHTEKQKIAIISSFIHKTKYIIIKKISHNKIEFYLKLIRIKFKLKNTIKSKKILKSE